MMVAEWSLLMLAFVAAFVMGAIVGSFLNVCIARLPQEKSLLWPNGSRCGHCFQPVRWYDNIPLVSYWVLRGRCRSCGAAFSSRYFLVELATALGYTGIFYLVVIANVHLLPGSPQAPPGSPLHHLTSDAIIFCIHHAILFSFLLVVAACDLDRREIPLSVTFTGAATGLLLAMIFPWPWPRTPVPARFLPLPNLFGNGLWEAPPMGLWPWPFWWPLPEWLGIGGDWLTGLLTALIGLLAGTLMMRAIRWVFSTGLGVEALGLGDADLMMMAGAFLGWQPVVFAFFISPFVAIFLTSGQYLSVWLRRTIKVRIAFNAQDRPVYRVDGIEVKEHRLAEIIDRTSEQTGRRRVHIYGPGTMAETVERVERAVKRTRVQRIHLTGLLPFGPSLAAGLMVSCLCWNRLFGGPILLAFDARVLLAFVGVGTVMMLVMSYLLRLLRALRGA